MCPISDTLKETVSHAKLVDGSGLILVARTHHGAGELGLVGAIGVMLRLEAHGATLRIAYALLTHKRTIEEVACIELHARLVGLTSSMRHPS